MIARELKIEAPDTENQAEDDDSDRESQTRLITTRRLPSAPWTRSATTFLEQALAESVLVDGGLCVIQEIDAATDSAPEGSFDLLEIAMAPMGEVAGTRRARYAALVKNIPAPKRRRAANDT